MSGNSGCPLHGEIQTWPVRREAGGGGASRNRQEIKIDWDGEIVTEVSRRGLKKNETGNSWGRETQRRDGGNNDVILE